MEQPPFFTAVGDHLAPAPHARSFWSPAMVHGRLLGGLLARALEREHGDGELQFSRLTVDLFRNAPLKPVRIETVRVRDGRRIRVADATVFSDGNAVAQASAVLLRRTEQPSGRIPATPAWDAPDPESMPKPVRSGPRVWRFGADGTPARHWSVDGVRRAWLHETCELVAGEPLSPLVRAALAADSASPMAHAADTGLEFINADYTLYLSRMPVGEYIGLESGGHSSEAGVAVGHCTMHDRTGPVGYCMTAAVANAGVRTPRERAASR